MNDWYYSDTQRNRHGPVKAEDLAMLHENGQLAPETLVWREGMADWQPWREVMAQVLPAAAGGAPAPARATFATASSDAPAHVSGNPYEVVERSSPYAPPRAQVQDTSARVVTGGHVVYGGFWKRFAAAFIDNFVTTAINYAVMIPLMIVLGLGSAGIGGMFDENAAAGLGIGFMLLSYGLGLLVPALYFAWMHSSGTQASLGKMAVGIKLVRGDGSPVSFWRAFLRYLAFVLTVAFTCGLGLLVSAIMTGVTERKQALHDLICDTLVVDKHAFTEHPEYQRDELGVVTLVVIGLFVLGLLAVLGFFLVLGAALSGQQ